MAFRRRRLTVHRDRTPRFEAARPTFAVKKNWLGVRTAILGSLIEDAGLIYRNSECTEVCDFDAESESWVGGTDWDCMLRSYTQLHS